MERDIVKRIEDLMDLFDEGEVTTANQIQRPEDPYRDFNERNPLAGGGRIPFAKAKSVKKTYTDTLGRTYDVDNMGRPTTLEGKTGKVVKYLQDLPDGASFYKPDVAKLLNLGVQVKDGKEFVDTSLLTKIINRRPELKNKNFKFLTKTDMTVKKINDFVEIFIQENGREPTQGEIQKGAKTDPTRIRTYIEEGKVKNVADTVFDTQTKAANYILNTKKPTIKGLEKIVGKGKGEKLLARVYINSLGSLKKKFSNIDEGRSIYKNFNKEQIQLIKNKVRRVPGFTEVYAREITDLISDAYPNPKDVAKKKAALKKVSMFKKFNKEIANKFGFNQVLDHPLSYDFITKTSQGVDASELIRVRPLPDRVNTFKSFLEQDLEEISNTLKKGYNQAAYNKYLDAKSIADELKIPFPTMSKKGTIISKAAAKVGDKPLIGDVKQAAVIQNNFRKFVQNVKNDPRMQRLGINLKELTDLAKLPEINIEKYDAAVKKFISKSGKFGLPFAAGYLGVRELSTPAQAADGAQTPGFTTGEKIAAGAAAGTVGTKPGRKLLGKAFRTLGTRAAGSLFAADQIRSNIQKGENIADAVVDPLVGLELSFPGLFKENVAKITKNPTAQRLLNLAIPLGRFARFTTPVGAVLGIAGLGVDYGKFVKDELDRIKQMTPEEREAYNIEQQEQMGVSAAEGGLIGDKSGPPPESGPTPHGLPGLLKRGRKG